MPSEWTMPAETAPHECAWMSWPTGGYALGDSEADAEAARTAWATVANAIVDFEPLHMLVDPSAVQDARRLLSGDITLHEAPLDDAWYRDSGPTFVVGPDGLGAVNWVFNGWGQQEWATWENDALASEVATDVSGAHRIGSAMVNEGGAFHTDGEGTFITTEAVLLDPLRNPDWSKQQIEDELARTLGARKVIWLPRGLTRDTEKFGTKGHVDIVATFSAPGQLLVHDQLDPAHPDAEITAQAIEQLCGEQDAEGRPLRVTALPAPTVLRDAEGWVDYSYVNHFVLNGAVIACSFDDPNDAYAAAILSEAYPGRKIVTVDARPIFALGGGIHCITQQQPAVDRG